MMRVAAEHHVTKAACLAGTGLTSEHLENPAVEIDGKQELSILRNIVAAVGPEVPFGLLAGERYHLTSHGMWGFALLSSASVRQVINFSANHFELSYSFNYFDVTVGPDEVRLSYEGEHNPEDLRSYLVDRDMAAAITFGRDLLGHKIPMRSAQLRARRPRDTSAYALMFGIHPEFEARHNCLTFSTDWLDRRPTLADDFGQQVSEQYCRALQENRDARGGIAGRVRARIASRRGDFPSMDTVASEMGLSVRTLRNRLARESTSYRTLLDEVRVELAEQLLSTRMTVEQISEVLGYGDVSSFAAAFKRWTGTSPRVYRHSLR